MKPKQTKAARIAELERELAEAQALQIHNHHFASLGLDRAKDCMGSAVILTITLLGGRGIVPPVAISNGLSEVTVEALKADLVRSFNYMTELKPKGA